MGLLLLTLRHKLEVDPQRPQIISNELGIGYRLRVPADHHPVAPQD